MRCTVFGTGYLGATHAAGMAELGHEVVGVDIDPGKIAKLASGDIPFYEPNLLEKRVHPAFFFSFEKEKRKEKETK